jgi:hypothetical protein
MLLRLVQSRERGGSHGRRWYDSPHFLDLGDVNSRMQGKTLHCRWGSRTALPKRRELPYWLLAQQGQNGCLIWGTLLQLLPQGLRFSIRQA